jgi:hypothetical protein
LLNTLLLLLQHRLRWHDANVHDDVYACTTAKVSQWSYTFLALEAHKPFTFTDEWLFLCG